MLGCFRTHGVGGEIVLLCTYLIVVYVVDLELHERSDNNSKVRHCLLFVYLPH